MDSPRYVYKIVGADAWQAACATGFYAGSADDTRDGFIHLSFAHQVAGTLARHFPGTAGLLLLEIAAAELGGALVREPSRGGEDFPHLYGALPTAHVQRSWPLPLDGDRDVLPADLELGA